MSAGCWRILKKYSVNNSPLISTRTRSLVWTIFTPLVSAAFISRAKPPPANAATNESKKTRDNFRVGMGGKYRRKNFGAIRDFILALYDAAEPRDRRNQTVLVVATVQLSWLSGTTR